MAGINRETYKFLGQITCFFKWLLCKKKIHQEKLPGNIPSRQFSFVNVKVRNPQSNDITGLAQHEMLLSLGRTGAMVPAKAVILLQAVSPALLVPQHDFFSRQMLSADPWFNLSFPNLC